MLRRFLVPTLFQATVSVSLALLFFIISLRPLFVALIARSAYVPEKDVTAGLGHFLNFLSANTLATKAVIGLFWLGIGLLVYIGYLIFANGFVGTFNEFIIDTTYTNKGSHLLWRLKGLVRQALLAALLITAVLLSLNKL